MITIACVLRVDEGSRYNINDVKKLKKGFEVFLDTDHRFVCLSNIVIPMIETIPLVTDLKGWWSKIELFRPNLFDSDVFYIDLDMVICNDLLPFLNLCQGHDFLMLNHIKDSTPGSGIMYWQKNDHSYIYDKFMKDPARYQQKYTRHPKLGDQAFISENIEYSFFNDIQGFNKDWLQWLDYKENVVHPDTKILIGCGNKLKPSNPKFRKNLTVNKFWRNI